MRKGVFGPLSCTLPNRLPSARTSRSASHRRTQSDTQHQPGAVAESFTYWRESDGHFLGYLNAYPDHWTQGEDLEGLRAQLLDLYH